MKVEIVDREVFGRINPYDVAIYLRTHGWEQLSIQPGRAAVWQKNEQDVLLPLDRSFADFSLRTSELVHVVAQVEDRSELELLDTLTRSQADTVRVRISGAGDEPSLEVAAHSLAGTRELLLAAASATLQPRPCFPGRRSQEVVDYMRTLQMGQTERGSLVFTIHSPVPPAFFDVDEDEMEQPFPRRVLQTLSHALGAMTSAAGEATLQNSLEPFQRAVHHGVSANLCDAAAQIGDGTGFELGLDWSTSRPMAGGAVWRTIPQDLVPVIREAARLLRERAAYEDFHLQGAVVRLERTDPGPGHVTILGLVEGTLKRVRVPLDEASYSLAIQAHEEGREVSCTGSLVRDGRNYALRGATDFRIKEEF